MSRKSISILSDNPESWIQPFCLSLAAELKNRGFVVDVYKDSKHLEKRDILFILGCQKILQSDALLLHKHNLVVHESDLPKGKGWSPMSWQILEEINKIRITLFEASRDMDSGLIYYQDIIHLEDHELVEEQGIYKSTQE